MKVYLEFMENELLKDSVKIVEKMPNLIQLNEDSSYYELVGSQLNNSSTNDPCRTLASLTSEHNINHFGKNSLIVAIQNIAREYNSLHPNQRLRINDMSIEFGGKFDISNNWRGGHATHRIGTNADIGFTGVDENGNCVNLNNKDLKAIIKKYSSREPYREGSHYHIYVNN